MPDVTFPQTVYCLSRKRASPKQIKNCELAEFGSWARAIEQVPRTCGSAAELGLEIGIFRAARARPMRTAGLRHEPLDDAMKDNAVVEFFFGQFFDMRDMGGREIGPQCDDDRSLRRVQCERVPRLGHSGLPVEFSGPAIADARPEVNRARGCHPWRGSEVAMLTLAEPGSRRVAPRIGGSLRGVGPELKIKFPRVCWLTRGNGFLSIGQINKILDLFTSTPTSPRLR